MEANKKCLIIASINYIIWVLLLSLGSYLFFIIKNNEAPGGIVLSLSSAIFGIIIPFHFKRTNLINYKFFPEKQNIIKTILITSIFFGFCLFIFPSGILGIRLTFKFLTNLPNFKILISTFLFLLFSAIVYGFIFWGGLLFSIKNNSNTFVAIILTSILFSLYHFSQFPFTPITINFLAWMFVWSIILTSLTILNNSVLPTIIVHQFGQFIFFASSNDNPFTEIGNSIGGFAMLGILFFIYFIIFRKVK